MQSKFVSLSEVTNAQAEDRINHFKSKNLLENSKDRTTSQVK